MEKSEKAPQLREISTGDKSGTFHLLGCPEVSVNSIFYANVHHDQVSPTCFMDACTNYQIPCRSKHMNQEWRTQPAHALQHVEQSQNREPNQPSAWMNLPQPLDGCLPHHAEITESGEKGECSYRGCGPDQCGTVEPANRNTTCEDEYISQSQSDVEEELELPLPLKADDEGQNQSPFPLPHSYNFQHVMDARHYYFAEEEQCNINPGVTHPPRSLRYSAPYLQNRNNARNWLQHHDSFTNDSVAQGGVSVNVPQFSIPPVEGLSQVSVQRLSSAAAVLNPQERRRRRAISLPEECRNVFITYSSDVSLEMVSFVEILTKQGFRPAIDLFDNPIRYMDINKWSDAYLKDPSTLIIIAISPKYKKDIKGNSSSVDSHGLQTKYIHSLMQNEFIQQGSLNFRFIPVLFLGATQKHVPSWLQNTRVYRWPQDSEDLLLRLLKEERYVPPSVPGELTLLIRPVTTNPASMV